VSSDKTIDALYAFTDCEITISPNCCVISDNKPHFLTVSDVLRVSVDKTKEILRLELDIERREKQEALLFASLEKYLSKNAFTKTRNLRMPKTWMLP